MKPHLQRFLTIAALLFSPVAIAANTTSFHFGVLAANSTATLKEAIWQTDRDNLAFVVANGIKVQDEPCSDTFYQERYNLLDSAKNGLIVSLAARDWVDCLDSRQDSAAMTRLNHLRETFFTGEFSLGDSKLPLIRQSAIAAFSLYAENMQWQIGDILFATLHLPANNNNFQDAAGRNGEYEDRQVANHDWLKRLFTTARNRRLRGIVLFADANPLASQSRTQNLASRDGFAAIRRQLIRIAKDFPHRILVVYGSTTQAKHPKNPPKIIWKDNIGTLYAAPTWTKIRVEPTHKHLFAVTPHPTSKDMPN